MLAHFASHAVFVMSADHPVGPRLIGDRVQISVDGRLQRKRVPGAVQQREVQWQMHSRAVVASVEMTDAVRLALNFATQHTTFEFVDDMPKFFDVALRFRTII